VRLSVALLVLSLAGALFGAWLIAVWAVGVVIVAYSMALAVIALLRDDGQPESDELDVVRRRRSA
jgi:hypothetical protein